VGSPEKQTGFMAVNGTRLYYEVAGHGEPIVLIHGFTLDTRMWDDQFDAFARSYRVIRYDARGFGRSAPIIGPYSVCDDLKACSSTSVLHRRTSSASRGAAVTLWILPSPIRKW